MNPDVSLFNSEAQNMGADFEGIQAQNYGQLDLNRFIDAVNSLPNCCFIIM